MGRYSFLRRPKWLGLLLAVVIIVPAFFVLSRWQLNRLEERRHYNDLVTHQGSEAPVPLDTLLPNAPSGTVTVIGRIQPSQVTDGPEPGDMPSGQVSELDVELIGAHLGPVFPGAVELISSTPTQAAGLTLLPLPDLTDGPHLAYAIQWVLFAGVTVAGYVMLARREREYEAELAEDRAAKKAADKATAGGSAPNG